MEVTLDPLLTTLYGTLVGILGLYGLHRFALLWRFRWSPREAPPVKELPVITVQLPLYNERTVTRRLIRAAAAIDYPADKLEIQVLDDSTDETVALAAEEVERLRAAGIDAHHVRRDGRAGFKAGALAHGLELARGELVAVFDADFIPGTSFLMDLVGHFEDPKVGMVQARWGHENRDETSLTRAQSTLLDGHFVIEHTVRHDSGWFFNFNGTAGIWRKSTIADAGGWQHDTLTEDLDLSYRAQLAGWKFVYCPGVVAPAEVPVDIIAFKSQQHRWAKGSVQVLRKSAGTIVRSDVPWRTKLEALTHLTSNVGYPCVLATSFLLPLTLFIPDRDLSFVHLLTFLLCTISVILFYSRSQRVVGRSPGARLRDSISAMALGIGMCVSQTRAVFEGLTRNTGVFVRTPKRGDGSNVYQASHGGPPGIELVLALWMGFGLFVAIRGGQWASIPFLLLFAAGFTWVGWLSVRIAWSTPRGVPADTSAS